MGMFDTVVIEGLKLPNVPKEIRDYLKSNNETLPSDMQTKDLDNVMATYTINSKGQIFETIYETTGKKIPYEPFRLGPDNRSFLEKLYHNIKFSKLDRTLPKFTEERVPKKKKSNLTATFNAGVYHEIAGRYLDAEFEFVANKGKITKVKLLHCELESAKKAAERKARDAEFKIKMDASFEARRKLAASWYYPILREVYNPFVFFSRIIVQAACNKIIKWSYSWHGV